MRKILILFASILLLSCSDDSSTPFNETDLNLITGINLTDTGTNVAMQLGNPNVLNNLLTVYPNPPSGMISIKSFENIEDIWLVPAKAQKVFQTTNFNDILNSELYTESELDSNSELKFLDINFNNIQLNLENLSSGYYKLFVKIKGNIYWENIYVPNSNFDINDLIKFWD